MKNKEMIESEYENLKESFGKTFIKSMFSGFRGYASVRKQSSYNEVVEELNILDHQHRNNS